MAKPLCWFCGGRQEWTFFVEGAGSYEWMCVEFERHRRASEALDQSLLGPVD